MKRRGRQPSDLFSNPILVGSMILAIGLIGIVLSYRANRGLPFVPSYEIKVQVPDAAELIEGGSEVRVGGARVGLVTKVQAEPGRGGKPAYAELTLALEKDQEPIAMDSHVKVRPRSILGAKYLDLEPGRSAKGLPAGGTLPLSQGRPVVELDEAFNVFDDATTRGLQATITNLGDAFAGRGQSMNDGIAATRRLLPPLQRVLTNLIAPDTQLARFVRGTAAFGEALAPVAPELLDLFDNGAATLRALEATGPALGDAIEELPKTEAAGSRSLRLIRPVLADLASITRSIRPGTVLLPPATLGLRDALRAGTPILKRTPALADRLGTSLAALGALSRDPNAARAVRKLTTTVQVLKPTLDTLLPAQVTCNLLPVAFRNAASTIGTGDSSGSWFNFTPILNSTQDSGAREPAANLHNTPTPNANADECEAGNEPYTPGIHIGNPAGLQRAATDTTSAPAAVRDLAAAAGLVGSVK
jgi:virulence factor Mce-like protein